MGRGGRSHTWVDSCVELDLRTIVGLHPCLGTHRTACVIDFFWLLKVFFAGLDKGIEMLQLHGLSSAKSGLAVAFIELILCKHCVRFRQISHTPEHFLERHAMPVQV